MRGWSTAHTLAALGLALGLLLTVPLPVVAQGSNADIEPLLRSARIWRIKGRSELARAALDKALIARPDDPEALLQLGQLELRTNRFDAAKAVLSRLRTVHAGHPNTRALDDAYRIATTDRLAMATVRRQLQSYATQGDGIAGMRSLFPDGPPGDALGVEYWLAIGRQDAQWALARERLQAMAQAKPNDPQFELALARHLLRRDATRLEGLDRLQHLADRVDANPYRVMDAWRDGVLDLPPGPESDRRLALYLARRPDDQAVSRHADAIRGQPPPRRAERPTPAAPTGSAPPESALARPSPPPPPSRREVLAAQWAARPGATAQDAAQGLADDNLYRASLAARAYRAEGQFDLARQLLDDILELDPRNLTAIRERALWSQARRGDRAASAWLLKWRAEHPQVQDGIDRVRADVLDVQAEQALASGDTEAAVQAWQRAVQLDPENPWTRYALASELVDAGRRVSARRLMMEAVWARPDDADTRYAAALILSRLDDVALALDQLTAVALTDRSDNMQALLARLTQRQRRAQAQALVQRGDVLAAIELLQPELDTARAEHDAEGLRVLARFWQQQGRPKLAFDVFEPYLYAHADAPAPVWLAWVDLLVSEDRDELAALTLDTLLERDGLLAFDDGEPAAQMASLYQRVGRPADSAFWWRRALLGEPDRLEWQAELAQDLADMGETTTAREQLALLAPQAPPALAMDLAQVWVALDEPREAVRLAEQALAQRPGDAALRAEAGSVAESAGAYNRAAGHYRVAGLLDPGARADLAALRQRRQRGHLQVGLDGERKPGDPGVSENRAASLAVSLRWPVGMEHHLLAYLDPVRVDAGRLPRNFDDAADYGTVAALGPAQFAQQGIRDATAQRGFALGLGVETDRWRVDIGTSPRAFAGSSVVGSLAVSGGWPGGSWSADVSRRPVTSSLVSYAGGRDPVSDRVWGAVRETSLGARLAHDWGRWDAFVSPRYSRYAGTHVPDNHRWALRTGGDWLAWDRGWSTLFIGARATYWAYDNNQRFYTFGHGGYYSPQQYLSLGLPVLDLRGRFGATAWQLRGGLSYSISDEDTVPLFPTDPGLQTAAAVFVDPVNTGGSGQGGGYNLTAAVSQRLGRHWELGGRFAVDRSDFYEPNFFQLYLRYVWNTRDTLPSDPPRSVVPYALR